MSMVEDLSPFFSHDEFADSASIDGAEAVSVIFDKAYTSAEVGGLGVESTEPAITLATANVPASPRGTPVVVTSTLHGVLNYTIAKHEPDGTGLSVLFLEEAP